MQGEKIELTLPSGRTIERTEPLIPARVSSKTAGTTGTGTIVLGLVGVFFPDLMDSLTPEQAMWIGAAITTAVAWITARFTKTPLEPGKVL